MADLEENRDTGSDVEPLRRNPPAIPRHPPLPAIREPRPIPMITITATIFIVVPVRKFTTFWKNVEMSEVPPAAA